MKRTLILGAAIVLAAGLVWAGDYHTGDSLICSQCHVMHASLQHSYGGGTTGYPQSWTPSEYLLKGGINETCLICHDDDGAPDVLGPDTGYNLANRSAGGLNDANGPIDGYSAYMGHSLYSTDTAPGDTGSFVPNADHGLTCVDCHSQHGRNYGNDVYGNDLSDLTLGPGNYRNLVRLNGLSVSYSRGTDGPNDLTRDVFEDYPNAYEWSENNLNEPVITNSGFGEWCQGCHVNFHGAVGDPASIGGSGDPPQHFVRHPNATVNIGAVGGGHSSLTRAWNLRAYRVRVMSETGDWGTQGTPWDTAPATLTPTCLSCHKAHGNQRPFGLIYAKGDAPLGENGDGTGARDLCKQCHVQGG